MNGNKNNLPVTIINSIIPECWRQDFQQHSSVDQAEPSKHLHCPGKQNMIVGKWSGSGRSIAFGYQIAKDIFTSTGTSPSKSGKQKMKHDGSPNCDRHY